MRQENIVAYRWHMPLYAYTRAYTGGILQKILSIWKGQMQCGQSLSGTIIWLYYIYSHCFSCTGQLVDWTIHWKHQTPSPSGMQTPSAHQLLALVSHPELISEYLCHSFCIWISHTQSNKGRLWCWRQLSLTIWGSVLRSECKTNTYHMLLVCVYPIQVVSDFWFFSCRSW